MADMEYEFLREARSGFEAQVLAGILRSAGIPAYVEGGMLVDEFAATQQLMNLQAVRILVPASSLDRARAALDEAAAAGKLLDGDVDVPGDSDQRGGTP